MRGNTPRAAEFVSALFHTLTNPSAQGTLHDTAALLAFQVLTQRFDLLDRRMALYQRPEIALPSDR